MMLSSSPPFGPFSLCQRSPVTGCTASPSELRWPSVYTAGLNSTAVAPGFAASGTAFWPMNGLSFGTLPSSLSRSTLPAVELGSCASPPLVAT
jgi:hypothetical protein